MSDSNTLDIDKEIQAAEATLNARIAVDMPDLTSEKEQFNATDYGNAERLVNRHGSILRYCTTWEKWLVWQNTHWEKDEIGTVERMAKDTVRSIYKEAQDAIDDYQRTLLAKHAVRSESSRSIAAMIKLAWSQLPMPIKSEQLDKDPFLLNCKNGTVNLKTGELQPHKKEDYITKIIPVNYDSDAKCPEWTAFLNQIMDNKQDLISFLQRSIGYSLTGSTKEQCMFILHGNGANGKSTFLGAIRELMGQYTTHINSDSLMVKDKSTINNDIARLQGARMVTCMESEGGKRLAESLIKSMTGGDPLTARYLHAEFFDFLPAFKLWMGTNHKPQIRGMDDGIWRRIRLIPFSVKFPPDKQDRDLPEKLKKELPGILNWCVTGCQEWLKNGLCVPKEVLVATDSYKNEMDTIARFIGDCCTTETKISTRSSDLYAAYVDWCKKVGEYELSQSRFSVRMDEKGYQKEKTRMGMYWKNLSVLEDKWEQDMS